MGCGTEGDAGNTKVSKNAEFEKEDYQKIISANNELGFQLISEVQKDENKNIFISPTSLFMALSMVYNGADAKTKDEIAETLNLNNLDVEDLNSANASLMSMLHKESDQVQLNIANSIWLNQDYNFQEDFSESTKDYYNAKTSEIDIKDDGSVKLINDWVKSATNAKIKEIVEGPLNSDFVMMLINAIYFKGDWLYEFDNIEEKQSFHLADELTKELTFMQLNEELDYLKNDSFQSVVLPYGETEMSMRIFLPNENVSMEQFEEMLTAENWKRWHSEYDITEGMITIPKFQMEYEAILNEVLKKLGMNTAFNESADLSKMVEESDSLMISDVKQKTFINVNEQGTEAAAVTSVGIKTTSFSPDETFQMNVNRPFFIAITDDETDAILFMGQISNPQQVE